jgi:hypothetical protein
MEEQRRLSFVINEDVEGEVETGEQSILPIDGDLEEPSTTDTFKMNEDNIDIDSLAESFIEFSMDYPSTADAIKDIRLFINNIYDGDDYTKFADIVRSNYIIIVDHIMDDIRKGYERLILASL